MKVLVLTNLYPSRREPTRGMYNLQGFRALGRCCDLRLVVPRPWWTRLRRPSEWFRTLREDWTGIEAEHAAYFALPRLPRSHVPGMLRAAHGSAARMQPHFPFDAILAAMAYADGFVAARLAARWNLPLVTMVLGSDVNELARRPGIREEIQWGLGRSARVLCVSRGLRDRVLELGIPADRVQVQHNGVDGERFSLRDRAEARARLGLDPGRKLVCYVGNLVSEKGPDVLLEAMVLLQQAGAADVDLAMLGGGALEERLRRRITEAGLGERVRLVGRRPHGEVPDWIAAADLLSLPSHREGCPNVVLEALAAGRPVVASAVGGVPELLGEANGVLVPPGDPEALANGLREALVRSWDAGALRASVPCLSWDDFGRAIYGALQNAVREHRYLPAAAYAAAE